MVFFFLQGTLPTVPGGGPPPSLTPPPSTCDPETQFACRMTSSATSSSCIPVEKLCDFRNDCYDKSDESNCGKQILNQFLGLYNIILP